MSAVFGRNLHRLQRTVTNTYCRRWTGVAEKTLKCRFLWCQSRPLSQMSAVDRQNQAEQKKFRQDCIAIFDAAVESVSPQQLMTQALNVSEDGSKLTVEGRTYTLKKNVFIAGFGKAVSGMAKSLEDMIGQHVVRGVISIPHGSRELFKTHGKYDFCLPTDTKIEVYEGAKHNLPDPDAHHAALAILDLAKNLTDKDILVVLISGGGSALLPSPIPPITLHNALDLADILSKNGATIQELNYVRQNIEILKGGGLAQIAKPARVLSLILSDVIEDKLDIISSGPTVPLLSSPRQCLQLLKRLSVMDKVPQVVVDVLEEKASHKKATESSDLVKKSYTSEWDHVHNFVIGRNSVATETAARMADSLGYVPLILSNALQGEASLVAQMFVRLAKYVILGFGNRPPDQGKVDLATLEVELCKNGLSKSQLNVVGTAASQAYNSGKSLCIICGGETIVHVKGTGVGGRNQEMALAFAIEYHKLLHEENNKVLTQCPVEFLSAGTDGQDGPTDAAGAVVNRDLVPLAMSSKLTPQEYLDNNDSHTLFSQLKDSDSLIKTGLTCTNVMDVQLMLIKLI